MPGYKCPECGTKTVPNIAYYIECFNCGYEGNVLDDEAAQKV